MPEAALILALTNCGLIDGIINASDKDYLYQIQLKTYHQNTIKDKNLEPLQLKVHNWCHTNLNVHNFAFLLYDIEFSTMLKNVLAYHKNVCRCDIALSYHSLLNIGQYVILHLYWDVEYLHKHLYWEVPQLLDTFCNFWESVCFLFCLNFVDILM